MTGNDGQDAAGLDTASASDIFTWVLLFIDAEVRRGASARAALATASSVAGGGDDSVVIPYNGSGPHAAPRVQRRASGAEATAVQGTNARNTKAANSTRCTAPCIM